MSSLDDNNTNATLVQCNPLTKQLYSLRVKPDTPFSSLVAGQFVSLALPVPNPQCQTETVFVKRSYSIVSSEESKDEIELYVARVDGGVLTPHLCDLSVPYRLWMSPQATGYFVLAEVPTADVLVLVATGTGLAPYLSMLTSLSTQQLLTRGYFKKCMLIHGVRQVCDLGYQPLIKRLTQEMPCVYVPVVSRDEQTAWSGLRGHIQQIFTPHLFESFTGYALSPLHAQVMLCGHPLMIESMQTLLAGYGFKRHRRKNKGHIHFEKYWDKA